MKSAIVSFSQNTTTGQNSNSSQIGNLVKEALDASGKTNEVDLVHVSDYTFLPCTMCGACKESHNCHIDKEFASFFDRLKGKDLIIGVVPYYSPIPSSVAILLEKFNQIMVSANLSNHPLSEHLKEKKVGLIVHGGMIDCKEVRTHYEQMIARPLTQTLKSLGLEVLQSDSYQYGISFGLENEQSLEQVKGELFPKITHRKEFIKETLNPYVAFIVGSL